MTAAEVLTAYRTLDPAAWVRVYTALPLWGAAACVVAGLLLLLMGGGRAFRLVAAPVGAVVGGLWIPVVAARLGLVGNEKLTALVAAAGLAGIGMAHPPAAVFFAFGLPAGLVAGELAGGTDWLLGFVPAFLLVGTLAALLQRWIRAIVSSVVGAWLFVLGVLASLDQVGTMARTIAAQPLGVVAAAGLFAVAGAVFQLAVRPPEEQPELKQLERRRAKRDEKERQALEKRWSSYSDRDR